MRRAMAEAEVGDDVFGEDPTVNALQERAAQLFGREAALFVPSGMMGNQIALKVHTQPGDEVILEEASHIFNAELAMMGAFSGVMPRPVPTERGFMRWEQIEPLIRPKVYYYSQTTLICLENTHNFKGGGIYPLEWAREIIARAHERGLKVHLDGARIFNAAVATQKSVRELTEGFDSVMFCLSKGLGAPVGSMLVGSREFIEQARRVRKMLGGGMRQAGILAAAGLYALEHHVERLREDHENAQLLAQELKKIPEISLEPVETNIIVFTLQKTPAERLVHALRERGILVHAIGPRKIRLVTHLDVSRSDVLSAAGAIAEILQR
ncbi:MAG: aminotransferase class V-fold PLP-dependent enzyme [Candidatus Bipolaricaulota bacterium]|nr:aminotransferase class V-fold PLP-dependent enzyme [Candidatus Bipolaricaulota bacterium]MCS7275239.1 aminotransferase class V-fold PLP-dependent enzyme [Candidatus Bipolaricaulota bacterium]MDW8111059.1 GntG family PLP-dependent aldolase [Candidatus Bipolaricaulota bacterium]MDW8329570.1 GntG family PLP-dependent aldolase [Candidatus Bipolaricaulota bacterium]